MQERLTPHPNLYVLARALPFVDHGKTYELHLIDPNNQFILSGNPEINGLSVIEIEQKGTDLLHFSSPNPLICRVSVTKDKKKRIKTSIGNEQVTVYLQGGYIDQYLSDFLQRKDLRVVARPIQRPSLGFSSSRI